MSLIAESYTEDNERSRAMGIAMGGYALGILVGYPFGGLLYAVSGKTAPFVGIFVFCLINIGIQFWCLDDIAEINKVQMKSASLHRLLLDPYILLCAGSLMITSMSLAVLESTVPIWVMDTMGAQQWQLGLIFIPDSVGYLVGTNSFPVIARKYGRWKFTCGSMFLIGIGMLVIPFCKSMGQLLVPHLSLGLGVGVTDAAIMPLLALLIDQRHVSTYGSVYAIVQLAVCLAYSLGPAVAGQIVRLFGFKWSIWGMAILNLLFLPLCVFLKSPPVEEDSQCILQEINKGEETTNEDKRTTAKYHSFYSE
ncbi:synaptic vesicular amine transporter-like [Ruditapes philippinarum]|uniref:synaptic vesicular amine transporter-like n=1 Tax=Ruditapes philippinarum TaxID=129788 RepID=UPI00295BAB5D|nr:synaptic vesicular amine transporter-like [Ruditapes philippinarum]